MLSFVARGSALSPYLKPSTTTVVNSLKPVLSEAVVLNSPVPIYNPAGGPTTQLTGDSLRLTAPMSGAVRMTTGLLTTASVRYAHTDIRVPDFSDYRRDSVKDHKASNRDSAPVRNTFSYVIVGGKGSFIFRPFMHYTLYFLILSVREPPDTGAVYGRARG